jgi:hypothetical protein
MLSEMTSGSNAFKISQFDAHFLNVGYIGISIFPAAVQVHFP